MGRSRVAVWLRRVLLAVLALLGLAAAGLYVVASRVPDEYRPASLGAQQRKDAAKQFAGKMLGPEFGSKIQQPEPFALSFSQEELNRYLGSMDEIAALAPGGRPGQVHRAMERAGLSEPAVALGEGVLTLMFRLDGPGKVLATDLEFPYTPDGRLSVHLRQVRLGDLRIPVSAVRRQLDGLRRSLKRAARQLANPDREWDWADGVSVEDVSAVLARVLASIDAEPISTDLPGKVNGRTFRVDAIDIREGELTLRFRPVRRP